MKTIEQLIKSFETKAAMDNCSIVSRDDLLTVVRYLKTIVNDSDNKISLNVGQVPSESK